MIKLVCPYTIKLHPEHYLEQVKDRSRFLLDLQVVPAAKEVTHLPIATDPSHATFWRNWVEPMALASSHHLERPI